MTDIAPAKKKHVCSVTVQRAPSNAGDARITISTMDEDREGDVLVPEGAVLHHYNRNPVVLFGHDSRSLPVGRTTHLMVQPGKGLQADFVWLKDDPFATRVRNAFDQGVLNAASVGFLPMKWEPQPPRGVRYLQWEMFEWSLVPIGANPNALRTLKQFGLDTPAPVARTHVLLDEILTQLRSGVVLSHQNEVRLERASAVLSDILTHITDPDEDDEDFGSKAVVFNDGAVVNISEEALDGAIRRVVDNEIARATGRLVDDEPLLLARGKDQPVIQISDEDLADLIERGIRHALNEGFNRLTGRVD